MDQKLDIETYIVDQTGDGERIDRYLAHVTSHSRSRLQKLIENDMVTVNEKAVKQKYKVSTNDRVRLSVPPIQKDAMQAVNLDIDILYEDEFLAVINKPRGLTVHPGAGRTSQTLVNALLFQIKDLSGIGGIERPGIVHRLDMDTSGIMLIAKNDAAHQILCGQFRDRTIKKEYLAIVHGQMKTHCGEIIAPIGRHPANRTKMTVRENGRYAHTLWKTQRCFRRHTLVRIQIQTGRTHQIRVHFQYMGHPVVGDSVYGGAKNEFGAEKQLLHAETITFFHPGTKAPMQLSAPIPEDMKYVLEKLETEDL